MIIHVVKPGETLTQIAREYGVSVESIVKNNRLLYSESLVVGQTIVIILEDQEEPTKPWGDIWVNGYAYPYINTNTLSQVLPSLTYITIFGYGFTTEGNLIKPDEEKERYLIKRAYEENTIPVFLLSALSEDGTFITYTDENDAEQDVKVSDLLKAFINQPIEFGVSLKSDEDLDLVTSEDEE